MVAQHIKEHKFQSPLLVFSEYIWFVLILGAFKWWRVFNIKCVAWALTACIVFSFCSLLRIVFSYKGGSKNPSSLWEDEQKPGACLLPPAKLACITHTCPVVFRARREEIIAQLRNLAHLLGNLFSCVVHLKSSWWPYKTKTSPRLPQETVLNSIIIYSLLSIP